MQYKNVCIHKYELPRWLSGKEHTGDAGDVGLIPGLGRCPGEVNDNPPKYMNLSKLWETVEDKRSLACCSLWGHKESVTT